MIDRWILPPGRGITGEARTGDALIPSTSSLRQRLALALGLTVLIPLTNAPEPAAADVATTTAGEWCTRPDGILDTGAAMTPSTGSGAGPTCAPAGFAEAEAVGQPADSGSCPVGALTGEGVYSEVTGECCYPAALDCGGTGSGKFTDCGCYGRPLVVAEAVVATRHVARGDWGDGALRPAVASLDPVRRAALTRFWLDNARSEHSAVAGFAKLVLDLLAVGAPAELVHRAQIGLADELRHARACWALASAYDGRAWGPDGLASPPLPLAGVVELAVATAREGCVGETIAAHLAAVMAERASDPAVVAVLRDIAREEAEHAELSWAVLQWCLAQGGDDVRDAVAAVFAEAPRIPADGVGRDPLLEAHGLLADDEKAAICTAAHREVVGALAGAVLSRAAA